MRNKGNASSPIAVVASIAVVVLLLMTKDAAGFSFSLLDDVGVTHTEDTTFSIVASSARSRVKIVTMRWSDIFTCGGKTHESGVPLRRNIGQVLLGDELEPSGYSVKSFQNVECQVACVMKNAETLKKLKKLIGRLYEARFFIDGLPAVDVGQAKGRELYRTGFLLGTMTRSAANRGKKSNVTYYVNNHLDFEIHYYQYPGLVQKFGIVYFTVAPRSVSGVVRDVPDPSTCHLSGDGKKQEINFDSITFTYSVKWIESKTPWKTRWDAYLKSSAKTEKIHWVSFFNVVSVAILQSVLLWYLLVRVVRRDILRYNEEDPLNSMEESGWKLVYGDVFRPPRAATLLSILVGSGCQVVCMASSVLFVVVAGIVSPASRGLLASLLVVSFFLFALVNGFVTAALIKFFHYRSWRTILLTSLLLPGFAFTVYLTLNFIHLGSRAASTLPFSSLLVLLLLWLGVSTFLCTVGAIAGFRSTITIPVKINSIPRTIPTQPWFMESSLSYVALGIIPFALSYVELRYLFSSVWMGTVYHMFGFLTAAYLLLLVLVMQISVFTTYYQLSLLDHRWWWRSFLTSTSYGVWLFLYSIFYYLFVSEVAGFASMLLYFGYMLVGSVVVCLMFGAVGVLASFVFVRVAYASVKIE